MPMPHQLPSFCMVGRKSQSVYDVVQPSFEQLQQILAGNALHARGLLVVAAELPLRQAVHALQLLLFAQLRPIVRKFSAPSLSVLTRGIGTTFVTALVGVAAIALEEELRVFPATEAANRTRVLRHRYSTFLVRSWFPAN